jgi:LPXTG-motif cell wall-anchored protein
MAKKHRLTRVGRLVGACAVVGALIAGPLAAAGNAATAPNLSSFAGQGTGFALRVVVDLSGLPQAAKDAVQTLYAPVAAASGGKLPANFPFVIDQRFIETLSQLGSNTHAQSLLGQGVLQDVLGKVLPANLNKSASASKTGDNSTVEATPTGLPTNALPLINMGLGTLHAAIPTATHVTSDGTLASVSTSLQGLLNILPPAVQQALTEVTNQVNGVIDQVNGSSGTLGSALNTVGNTLASTTDPVLNGILGSAGLPTGSANAGQLVQQLQSQLQLPHVNDLLNGVAASINGLVNTAAAEKSGSKAFSDASSSLASVNVLNLLKVGVINLKSHSEAGGVAGTAKNTRSCSIANVNLANGTGAVSLDGKTLTIGGVAVPVPAIDVGTILNAVNTVTNAAGLSISLCDASNATAAADGSSASQTVSALRIVFAPLATGVPAVGQGVPTLGITQGTPLVKIIIDPSVETAASAQVAAVAPASQPVLPHTGAGTLATILTGAMVAGGALILRRRLAA